MTDTRRGRYLDPVLLAAVSLGALLRLWGLSYGLPHVYNPDEASIMARALSLADGDLNPHNFVYPSLYFYLLAAAVGGYFMMLSLLGRVGSIREFEHMFWVDPTAVYLVGRLLSVAAGVLTIVAVYGLAQKLDGRPVARTAAILMAIAYFPVRDAHFIKHDVPVTLVITLAVIAAGRVWRRGTTRDYASAGALAGLAFALHYYAIAAIVPVLTAHALRAGARGIQFAESAAVDRRSYWQVGLNFIRDRRLWIAVGASVLVFACLSPYVLLDFGTALRDIAANRQIVVDRALATYGVFGAGREHVRLLVTQGVGPVMLAAAIVGVVALVRESPQTAAWFLSFPVVFFLALSNSWPFGRSENPLYPFLVTMAAFGIHWLARRTRAPVAGAAVLTVACSAQPLMLALIMDRLMTRTDTRSIAKTRIEREVPAGTGIAVEPYSVPLTPTRQSLEEAVTRNAGNIDHAGYRVRSLLALNPYPAPAYRLYYLGVDGRDEDKIYYAPADLMQPGRLEALEDEGLSHLILKRFTATESSPLRERLASVGHIAFRVSPFREGSRDAPAQLPDYDIRPTLDVDRPGPLIEVWKLHAASYEPTR